MSVVEQASASPSQGIHMASWVSWPRGDAMHDGSHAYACRDAMWRLLYDGLWRCHVETPCGDAFRVSACTCAPVRATRSA